ncbi:MAG: hypothetical protein KGH88_03360 [Thaumarchaeota archaeon]|nr:hypothetical protein [Nitrososphaerota archaeon]
MKVLSHINWNLFSIILLLSVFFSPSIPSYGHLYGYNFQEWRNQKDNLRIQFDTDPQTPIAGNMSTLMFSVQNLRTGQHLQNFTARIAIINASSNYPISVFVNKDEVGDFAQKYTFPSGGTYEILLRVDSPSSIDVSRFTVFASSPSFQVINLVYLLLPIIILLALLGVVFVFIVRFVYKKK